MGFLEPGRAFYLQVRSVRAVVLAGALAVGSSAVALAQAVVVKGEAPLLAAQVAAGKLPSVDKRVPKNPLVITPAERVGVYGGTLRSLISGAGDYSWFRTMFGYDHLVTWDQMAQKVLPNLAVSWEVSPDATTYTFKLREGTRWSDGEPFTSKDVLFWWNDIYPSQQLPPEWKPRLIREGANTKVEAPDDYTVVFRFDKPYALFLFQMATPDGDIPVLFPEHYLKKFHIKYNPDADTAAKAAGFANWADQFVRKADAWNNPERPTIFAWKIERPLTDTQRVTLSRNPYYWKVDSAGNQLPYIDGVTHDVVADKEVMLLKALNGEVDFIGRYINTLSNKPVLVENEKKAGLKFFELVDASPNYMTVHLNQTHMNPVMREILSNKDFRIGLSMAINRQEIIDLVFAGQGRPYQVAPRPESEFYDEEFGTQYTQYDPAAANKQLDKAGFAKKDSAGFRLGPDGKRISIIMTVREDRQPMVDSIPFIVKYWRAVGIDANFRVMEKSAYLNQRNSNLHDGLLDDGDGGMLDALILPRAYIPIHTDGAYGTAWVNWVTGLSAIKQEPPPNVMAALKLYDEMRAAANEADQKRLFRALMKQSKENFLSMGIGLPVAGYGAHTNRLHNVPPAAVWSGWPLPFPGPSVPAQFFIQQ
jgi:peptide/nickel transport system substrate-binding protein